MWWGDMPEEKGCFSLTSYLSWYEIWYDCQAEKWGSITHMLLLRMRCEGTALEKGYCDSQPGVYGMSSDEALVIWKQISLTNCWSSDEMEMPGRKKGSGTYKLFGVIRYNVLGTEEGTCHSLAVVQVMQWDAMRI